MSKKEHGGTYISTKINSKSNELLDQLLKGSGIIPNKKPVERHMTLLYAPDVFIPRKIISGEYLAKVIGYAVLGEGKYQGLVLKLKCPKAHTYFDTIIAKYGKVHSYDGLNAHVTIKYRPDVTDLAKLQKAIPLNTFLVFENTLIEDLEDS